MKLSMRQAGLPALGCGVLAAALVVSCGTRGPVDPKVVPIEVLLCDGETTVQVEGGAPQSAEQGQQVANQLMAKWLEKNPGADWEVAVRKRHHIEPSADNTHIVAGGQEGHVGGAFTTRDVLTWKREAERFAANGARIFHDGGELGSTIAVSCDMCHPDASNTHPETYPKFQVQTGQVALLRDMINWCLEHPVRGEKLAADDPKMRALEAYIYAQRRGVPLEYGKH